MRDRLGLLGVVGSSGRPSGKLTTFAGTLLAILTAAVAHGHDFWAASSRSMARTPQGHVAAISCHNCYGNENDWDSDGIAQMSYVVMASDVLKQIVF